jgi:NAD(P)-dependent dehydrogenase (short-subunit alcohol dehydrogenase family)
MACPGSVTTDGYERQFAVNYLAHFTLTTLLLPTLMSSGSPTFNSRVVWVSSTAHRYGAESLDVEDMGKLKGDYEPWAAYGHSKIAMIWASNYLDRTYGPRGVHSLSLNPGAIASNLTQFQSPEQVATWRADKELSRQAKSPEQGVATQVWAAAAPVWEGKGGKYLNDVKVAEPAKDMHSAIDPGYGHHVYDPVREEKLWKMSLEMAKLKNP